MQRSIAGGREPCGVGIGGLRIDYGTYQLAVRFEGLQYLVPVVRYSGYRDGVQTLVSEPVELDPCVDAIYWRSIAALCLAFEFSVAINTGGS